ncbi:MAG TPA: hypothetical protein VF666_12755 [Pyrinomonadaceae bacterium]|jgi:hypothetical protein
MRRARFKTDRRSPAAIPFVTATKTGATATGLITTISITNAVMVNCSRL